MYIYTYTYIYIYTHIYIYIHIHIRPMYMFHFHVLGFWFLFSTPPRLSHARKGHVLHECPPGDRLRMDAGFFTGTWWWVKTIGGYYEHFSKMLVQQCHLSYHFVFYHLIIYYHILSYLVTSYHHILSFIISSFIHIWYSKYEISYFRFWISDMHNDKIW